MLKTLLALMLGLSAAFAQSVTSTGSVSGMVKDADTGTPIRDARVFIRLDPKPPVSTTTDDQGRYTLREVPPGQHWITAQTPTVMIRAGNAMRGEGGASANRRITLTAGQDLTSFDFQFRTQSASISGKVSDENGEPVPEISVWAIGKQYQRGVLYYSFAGRGRTDDRGEYTVAVRPGYSYLVKAGSDVLSLAAVSSEPADLKLRKKLMAPTYYPNSTALEGGETVVLRAGERREGVDIRMAKSNSYCVEGRLDADGAPAALDFEFSEEQPSNSPSSFSTLPSGRSGPDGKIRLCGLHPGRYRLTVAKLAGRKGSGLSLCTNCLLGTMFVNITDQDVRGVTAMAAPGKPLPGEVVWDGTALDKPSDSKVTIQLQQLTGFTRFSAESSIPGGFSYPGVWVDDYAVSVSGLPAGSYVKDISYGGVSVLHDPLHFGSALGNAGLRVVLARDGGSVNARVTDKDGKAVPDTHVYVMPASVASQPVLSAVLVSGQTDQNGAYASPTLAPGKYYVLASDTEVVPTPESIEKLWGVRTRAKEAEISPGSAPQVTLEPISIQ